MARFFLEPVNATHRQYEALRAYFVDKLSSAEVARRFGYSPGSFRVLTHQFRQNPKRAFFLPPQKGPQASPKTDPVRDQVVALRKQNCSIYDISRILEERGQKVSAVTVSLLLKEEGFARLPRRKDEERLPGPRPEVAAGRRCRPARSFAPAHPDPVRGAVSVCPVPGPDPFGADCSKRRGSRGHR